MNDILQPDWDPKSDAVQRDQRAAYDEMRERCPVAYSDFLGWSVFRHQDIVRVLMDPDTFSNAASRHLSVPDGMDPPEHTEYRRMIAQYFRPERVDAFEPQCREIAAKRLQSLLERDELEFIGDFAHWFAVRIQSASLGWPLEMCEPLRLWTQKNHQATFAQDRTAMAEVAKEFEGYVHELLQIRRAAGAQASDDITSSLLRQQVQGRPLRDEEIVSIVRNWTVGEVGTISAALGILVHYLSQHPELQQQLRTQPSLLPVATEEILRIYGPFGRQPPHHHSSGRDWWQEDRRRRTDLADLDFCQPRWSCFRGSGGVSAGPRPDRKPAIWGGNPRLPRRSSGSDGDACGDGGDPRAHDPHRPDPGPAAHRRGVPRQWFRHPAHTTPIGGSTPEPQKIPSSGSEMQWSRKSS